MKPFKDMGIPTWNISLCGVEQETYKSIANIINKIQKLRSEIENKTKELQELEKNLSDYQI